MTIGSFCLVKNEAMWIAGHLDCWLPALDEMVLFDGNSTDGTLEIIKRYRKTHPHGKKITLVQGMDPKDLKDDYVRMFNECMWTLKTDWAFFLHPDMIADNPEQAREFAKRPAISGFTHMKSVAGDPGGDLLEITAGRAKRWKNLYRLRNPNLGAHYHGWYGAANEDVYFSEITGGDYSHHGPHFERYPYHVEDSGLHLTHFSDVRPYERRLGRMVTCLRHQGYSLLDAERLAPRHPRVSLKDGQGFAFRPYYGPIPMSLPNEATCE